MTMARGIPILTIGAVLQVGECQMISYVMMADLCSQVIHRYPLVSNRMHNYEKGSLDGFECLKI